MNQTTYSKQQTSMLTFRKTVDYSIHSFMFHTFSNSKIQIIYRTCKTSTSHIHHHHTPTNKSKLKDKRGKKTDTKIEMESKKM